MKEDILKYLVLGWHQNGTKMNLFNLLIINELNFKESEMVPRWDKIGAKIIERKGLYLLQIMILCLIPKSMNELLEILNYNNRTSFREKYLNILDAEGYIEKNKQRKA